jgi:Ca2+:H+ antiporter
VFFLSALAIIPLAKYIGQATEELAAKTSAAFGGFLNVTFGNATELIIGIFALRAGLIGVVKASITGSIIGNLLLVLGTAIVAGGLRHKKQSFNRTGALAGGSTLFLAVTALIIPAILPIAAPATSSAAIEQLSVLVALCMVALYVANLLFSLFTHKHLYGSEVGKEEGDWSLNKSTWVLLGATLGVAWMSNMLVGTIDVMAKSLGWTELFVGVVIVAIVGNAAEHASAIVMAMKNKMDLALQISIGSATQMVMFVTPVFVFVSLLFQNQMTLIFDTFELACMFLSVIIVNLIIADGESNWLEGAQLLVAYAIMAIAFFIHP